MKDADPEECTNELRTAFIDAGRDQVRQGERHLEFLRQGLAAKQRQSDIDDTIRALRRVAHNLKGTSHIFGFPALSFISHQLGDYLSNVDVPAEVHIRDLQIFFDEVSRILEEGEPASVADVARKLPAYQHPEDPRQKVKSAIVAIRSRTQTKTLEAVLIMPSGTLQRKIIEYELAACGFRITNVSSSTSAIEMTLRIRPDIILSNQVIDDLISGVELAQFFHMVEATRKTPFILLTSFERGSRELKDLPPDVKVARKNELFIDDLAKCLLDFNFLPQWMTMG